MTGMVGTSRRSGSISRQGAACLEILCLLGSLLSSPCRAAEPEVRIGSKVFTESVILGEMVAHLVESTGARAGLRNKELGGTRVLWNALRSGAIDVYPEYTGTISEEILAGKGIRGEEAIRQALAEQGIRMSRSLGFNDTYAIGMRKDVAARLGITKLSDLRQHPDLKLGLSNEFLDRGDGWKSLRDRYGLPQRDVRGLAHELAYRALANGSIDATDLYSTDAEIRGYDVKVLEDDLGHFPAYHAVLLYRDDLASRAPEAVTAMLRLEGLISEADMIALNARTRLDGVPESVVAADFLAEKLGLHSVPHVETMTERLLRTTREHLFLSSVSLAAAVLVAVPLGVLAVRRPTLGQVLLGSAGIIQTIPSLALLVFMMSLLEATHRVLPESLHLATVGTPPAILALFLYSLLPIMANTHAGLKGIPGSVHESAAALGLPSGAQLRLVELPMASRSILTGIKTAAVINVGFATLGGFIGAGGYGQPIFTGIRLDDRGLILQGAIPAALLALLVQGLFEGMERVFVPKGLRLKAE
jgi:osmoprotectant transport system permease protein